jgi:uncharacterized protein
VIIMMKKLCLIATGMLLSILCYFLLNLYIHQEQLLFKSEPLDKNYQFSSTHFFKELFITTNDKASLHAILYKTPSKISKGVILYFHGRGGNLATYWNEIPDDFLERDYDVLVMDYRGFGKSEGQLSEKALLGDAEKLYNYAIQHYKPENIVIYGRSLGTGVATYVASKHLSKMLILEAPYFSIADLAYTKFPFVPKIVLDLFLKYPLHTDEWIQDVNTQIEIFHGTSDALIPYRNSEDLHNLAREKNPSVQLNTILNGTHNNLSHHIDYKQRLDLLLN